MNISEYTQLLNKFVWYNDTKFEDDVIGQLCKFPSIEYLKKEDYYLFVIKDRDLFISNLTCNTILSDCRLFAMILGTLSSNLYSFIMKLNCNNIPEILAPPNTYYLTLTKDMLQYNRDNININFAIGTMQGQWLVKDSDSDINNPTFVGLTKEGILKKDAMSWIKWYQENVNKHMRTPTSRGDSLNHDKIMLNINICKNDGEIHSNILSFNNMGVCTPYISSDNNINIDRLSIE